MNREIPAAEKLPLLETIARFALDVISRAGRVAVLGYTVYRDEYQSHYGPDRSVVEEAEDVLAQADEANH